MPTLADEMARHEREVITRYLKKHHGDVGATAGELSVSRRTLEGKMATHGLRDLASDLRAKAGVRGPR